MDICKKTKDQIIYKTNYTFQKWPRHNNKYISTKKVNQQALAMLAFPVTTIIIILSPDLSYIWNTNNSPTH